jgi:hypothetical protein
MSATAAIRALRRTTRRHTDWTCRAMAVGWVGGGCRLSTGDRVERSFGSQLPPPTANHQPPTATFQCVDTPPPPPTM